MVLPHNPTEAIPFKAEYNFIIHPPLTVIATVKAIKDSLVEVLGRKYKSSRASAHISIQAIMAIPAELLTVAEYAASFCQRRAPFTVRFTHLGSYPNGAIYLAPDEASKRLLAGLMKAVNSHFPLKATKFYDPHITIARGLSPMELTAASALLATLQPDMEFSCNGLSLRKLNSDIGQFDIIRSFSFGSDDFQEDSLAQGRLF